MPDDRLISLLKQRAGVSTGKTATTVALPA
jgi:hypothetical protein